MSRNNDMTDDTKSLAGVFLQLRALAGKNVNQMAESLGIERQTWTYFEQKHAGYPVAVFVRALMMLSPSQRESILQSVASMPLPKLRQRRTRSHQEPEEEP
jgi:hypothetical protein